MSVSYECISFERPFLRAAFPWSDISQRYLVCMDGEDNCVKSMVNLGGGGTLDHMKPSLLCKDEVGPDRFICSTYRLGLS
jgi:hypothetical protein